MKFEGAVALSCVAFASAFQAPVNPAGAFNGKVLEAVKSESTMTMEMSKSLPFLTKPKNLEGYIGDKGFDPFGFSDVFDMKWLREAELKHGRVSMLAVVGFIVVQFMHIPGRPMESPSPLDALYEVGAQPLWQIFLFIGFLEFASNKGKITILDMFEDESRVPGDLGFDPLGFSKKGVSEDMQLKELENGRLAMCAIGGLIHHQLLIDTDTALSSFQPLFAPEA